MRIAHPILFPSGVFRFSLLLLLFLLPLFPARGSAELLEVGEPGADKVSYEPGPFIFTLQSKVITDHQTPGRIIDECRARLKKDGSLEISFPPQFPGYYVGVTITVKDGSFTASADGVPFHPHEEVSYRALRQELSLQSKPLRPGEKIEGYCNIDFVQTVRYRDGKEDEDYFSWCGTFVAVIREEGFAPLSEAAVKTYDVELAHHELGSSLAVIALRPEQEEIAGKQASTPMGTQIGIVHDTTGLAALRRNFRRTHPELKKASLLEITWDISPEAGLSDSGRDRLTLWFEQKGDAWVQRAYTKWQDSE